MFIILRYLSKSRGKKINNPDWQEPKVKPYLHQISPECIREIAVFVEGITTDEMDCDTCLVMQEILCDEIDDVEFLNFALENLDKLLSYIVKRNSNIRIHRDITGEMWFGAKIKLLVLIYLLSIKTDSINFFDFFGSHLVPNS